MPIHDQGYRRYGGGRDAAGRGWLVIARSVFLTTIAKRKFLGLLLVAWGPFLVNAVRIYLSVNFPQVAMLAPTAQDFRQFFEWQGIFVFFITVYVGAGLIANDRRANALQIYLSKPLTRFEYVAGKAAALMLFLLFVTWLPAIMLLVLQVLFAGSFEFAQKNAFLFPAITVYAFVQVVVATAAMLALSSLSKSSRFVGIMFAGIMFFTDAVHGVIYLSTRSTALSVISPTASLAQIGDVIFRVDPRYDTPWGVSLLAVLVLVAVSVIVLERRVRGVEVVA